MTARYIESSRQGEPPERLRAAIEAELGERWLYWSRPQTGLSAAHRFLVRLSSGRSIFVKAATTPETEAWLRNEALALKHAPPDMAPRTFAWIETSESCPILVQEGLVDAHWPASHSGVTWREGDIDRVLAGIHRLAALEAPLLPSDRGAATTNWRRIVAEPAGFLALGLCSQKWLSAHGEALARAEGGLVRTGAAFVHGDMRSDNICIDGGQVKFVDWSNARRGAAETDLASFLPAARLEGGPAPFHVLPAGGGWGRLSAATWRCARSAMARRRLG